MVLSDKSIRSRIDSGKLEITPLQQEQIQPTGVDLRIDNEFRYYQGHNEEIDMRREQEPETRMVSVEEDTGWVIEPKQFALASTVEEITVPPDIGVQTEDRSSIARIGLNVQTAGYVEPGWSGSLTLELFNENHRPIRIYPGTRVCQLIFHLTDVIPEQSYVSKGDAKYQGQSGPTPSRINQDTH